MARPAAKKLRASGGKKKSGGPKGGRSRGGSPRRVAGPAPALLFSSLVAVAFGIVVFWWWQQRGETPVDPVRADLEAIAKANPDAEIFDVPALRSERAPAQPPAPAKKRVVKELMPEDEAGFNGPVDGQKKN